MMHQSLFFHSTRNKLNYFRRINIVVEKSQWSTRRIWPWLTVVKSCFLTAEGTESGTSISSWLLLTLYFFCFQEWNLKMNLESRSHSHFFSIFKNSNFFLWKKGFTYSWFLVDHDSSNKDSCNDNNKDDRKNIDCCSTGWIWKNCECKRLKDNSV